MPARSILLGAGLLAVGLGFFNLFHELHAGEVDVVYTAVAVIVGQIWLVCLVLAFLGFRVGVLVAGAIAFLEFGLLASAHFVTGVAAIGLFVNKEGLAVATVDMALLVLCAVVVMSAAVCWTNPRGRTRNLTTLSLLLVAFVGSILVILQATDDVHRADFGSATLEDGAFASAIVAAAWMVGGLWIASLRRTGAIIIALATFVVCYSFVTLHIVTGGTSMTQIASQSGRGWAAAAAGAAILSGASFLFAIGYLAWSFVPRKRVGSAVSSQAVRRGA